MSRRPSSRRAGLSKTRLLGWLQCPKRLWLDVNLPDRPAPDAGTELLFRQGHEVGDAAQALFADGAVIGSQDDLGVALAQTAQVLRGRAQLLITSLVSAVI